MYHNHFFALDRNTDGTYYVTEYKPYGPTAEMRQDVIADGLTKRQAERIVNTGTRYVNALFAPKEGN